jgi:hypothetical protein
MEDERFGAAADSIRVHFRGGSQRPTGTARPATTLPALRSTPSRRCSRCCWDC